MCLCVVSTDAALASAGTGFARGAEEQFDVVNESYSAIAVPGSFTLRRQNVEPESISVSLKSPPPPFELIPLQETVQYAVVPALNTFVIQVFSLPPQFVVPGTYDFGWWNGGVSDTRGPSLAPPSQREAHRRGRISSFPICHFDRRLIPPSSRRGGHLRRWGASILQT